MKKIVLLIVSLGLVVILVAGIQSQSATLSSQPNVASISDQEHISNLNMELDESLVARNWLQKAWVYGTQAVKQHAKDVIKTLLSHGGYSTEADLASADVDIVFDN